MQQVIIAVEPLEEQLSRAFGVKQVDWASLRQELSLASSNAENLTRTDARPDDDPLLYIPLLADFQFNELLGSGGFGSVWKAVSFVFL
jgi:hypothetical protein